MLRNKIYEDGHKYEIQSAAANHRSQADNSLKAFLSWLNSITDWQNDRLSPQMCTYQTFTSLCQSRRLSASLQPRAVTFLNIQTESDKSWRVTTTAAVFNIPRLVIEPLTQIVIYFFQIRHMSRIVIVGLVNIHHFHPKDYTSYLKWYSIKYDRGNTEWSVLAWIWLMVWKRKKTLYWN